MKGIKTKLSVCILSNKLTKKWSRWESNPCPKNHPMYFYKLS